MYDLIIRDATLVSSAGRLVADVAIKDGRIAYVGPRPPRPAREEIVAMGKFLVPGVIDTAVQFDPNSDPGIWERESRAAVTGGVTTVLALPGGEHPVVDRASAERRHAAASGRSWCNWGLWAAARDGNAGELARAADDGLVAATLAYLGSADPRMGISPSQLEAFLRTSRTVGVQLDVEDGAAGEPPGARALIEALKTDRPIHLMHLSTAAELNLLDPVRGQLPLTAGCTPHHLFLSRDETPIRTMPPVRPEHDRRTLWTAVKRGRLDCVASDHHPFSAAETHGVPGSELLFPLMLSAVRYGRLSLELLVSLCSESPARIFGLERKGRIARGADADLVLFSEGEVTRVDESALQSSAGWSPYADREAAPKPDLVFVNGVIVARGGALAADTPNGQCVTEA